MSLTHATDRLEVIHDDVEPAPTIVQDTESGAAESGSGTPPAGDTAGQAASTRPTFTITDAATSCSVSRKTITRKLPELAGHGAAKDDDGVWNIPVEALLAVGLHPGRSLPATTPAAKRPAPSPTPARAPEQDTVTVPRDRWDDLRIRLARAEAEASERAMALADARLALRALTAGPTPAGPTPAGPPVPEAQPAVPRVTPMPAGPAPTGPGPGSPSPADSAAGASASQAPLAPSSATQDPTGAVGGTPDEVVAARNLAARTGGYVAAAPAPTKKRRWWHSS